MKGRLLSFTITLGLAFLVSCHTAKQPTTAGASIEGEKWTLVMLNGLAVQTADQSMKEAHMTLSASEKRVNGNSGCNSFFGTYELKGANSITFSQIGATKMACQGNAMEIERQLFQAFEMTKKFTLRNDTLLLAKADMSPLAKFVRSDRG